MGQLEKTQFSRATYFLSLWKGYQTEEAIEQFVSQFVAHLKFNQHVCLVAVPFPLLRNLSQNIHSPQIILGCNAMHEVRPGSFTESIAGKILKMNSASFVLIGTAESRTLHQAETSNYNYSIRKALLSDITPFYCIGENLDELREGKSAEILREQCLEGLSDLSPLELCRVVVVYEAPWTSSLTERLPGDDLLQKYSTFKQAVLDCVGEEVFSKMRLINALPYDLEDISIITQLSDRGFFAKITENLIYALDAKNLVSQEPFKWEEDLTAIEDKIHTSTSFYKAEDASTLSSIPLEPVQASEKENMPKEDSEEFHDETAVEKQPDEGLISSVEEIFEEVNEQKETQELQEEAFTTTGEEHELSQSITKETAPANVLEDITYSQFTEHEDETALTPMEAGAGAGGIPISEAELEALASQITTSQPPDELQKLQIKAELVHTLDQSLAECYHQIQDKSAELPLLKKQFPDKLSKMTADLNLLDPALQEQINRGNIAFFTENPEKMQEAAGVLMQIQEINQLLQTTASIPRDVDRLISKGREIRKKLDTEWTFFRTQRQQIKSKYPNFQFPESPKQLLVQEPTFNFGLPEMSGPSPLVSKKVAVVRSPPPR